jgi:hypothetical protein
MVYIIVTCYSLIIYPDDIYEFFPINHFNYFKIFFEKFFNQNKKMSDIFICCDKLKNI